VLGGAAASSVSVGLWAFVMFVLVALYVAYSFGYGKNQDERMKAATEKEQLRGDEDRAHQESIRLRVLLTEHLEMWPDKIVEMIPIAAAWSPITTNDFDERPPSLVVQPPASSAYASPSTPIADAASP